MTALSELPSRGLKVSLRVTEMTRGDQKRLLDSFKAKKYARSAAAYLESSLCIIPSGDTITTRRLFDALEAGCVPVLARSWYVMTKESDDFFTALPFPLSVDWASFAPRIIVSQACTRHTDQYPATDADWLLSWHHAKSALERMRQLSRCAFRKHMDYVHNPRGVSNALLREIADRLRRQRVEAYWRSRRRPGAVESDSRSNA